MGQPNMLLHAPLVLEPLEAEVTLHSLLLAVHSLDVAGGVGLQGELCHAHETAPQVRVLVPPHVGLQQVVYKNLKCMSIK